MTLNRVMSKKVILWHGRPNHNQLFKNPWFSFRTIMKFKMILTNPYLLIVKMKDSF